MNSVTLTAGACPVVTLPTAAIELGHTRTHMRPEIGRERERGHVSTGETCCELESRLQLLSVVFFGIDLFEDIILMLARIYAMHTMHAMHASMHVFLQLLGTHYPDLYAAAAVVRLRQKQN